MQRYESYKPCGIQWVSTIPKHWNVQRAKWLFERKERPPRPEDGVVTAFRDGQVTLRTNRRTEGFTNAIQEHGYQGIRKGDLVIHAMDAFAGAIGVSESDGKSTPVYAACVPRGEYPVNSHYYAYMLRYMAHSGYVESLSKGIRERSTDFRFAEFRELNLPIPPKDEQDQIVNFLNKKTSDINAAITSKRHLIALLQEQKAIETNRAITKGLNSSCPMTGTNEKWLEALPAHWRLVPLLSIADVIDPNPSHRNPKYTGVGFPFVSTVEFEGDDDILLDSTRRVAEVTVLEQERRCFFSAASIGFSRKGTIGAVRRLPVGTRFALLDSLCVVNVKDGVDVQFMYRQLGANFISAQYGPVVRGAALKQLSVGRVRALKVLLPPRREQEEIARYIDGRLTEINGVIKRVRTQIEQLAELRNALISAVVTGQIKI